MSGKSGPGGAAGGRQPDPGDLGRRVALRRDQLGLTREEVAARAGMAPSYLQYVEERPADVSIAAVTRLTGALQTTVAELRGAGMGVPPGAGRAAPQPKLEVLEPEECRSLLSTHGVGRVAMATPRGPTVIPVNYTVVDDAIVYRTAPDAVPATAAGAQVAFEVDRLDETLSRGWSVLVIGRARQLTDTEAARRLAEQARSEPWAGGDRDLWIRIDPEHVTGRRISAG